MLDHDLERQYLHEIAVFFPVRRSDEIVEVVPAAALAALRLDGLGPFPMSQLDHLVVAEFLPEASYRFLLRPEGVPELRQRFVQLFAGAVRYLPFPFRGELPGLVLEPGLQLGPLGEQGLFPLEQGVPGLFGKGGLPVVRFVGKPGGGQAEAEILLQRSKLRQSSGHAPFQIVQRVFLACEALPGRLDGSPGRFEPFFRVRHQRVEAAFLRFGASVSEPFPPVAQQGVPFGGQGAPRLPQPGTLGVPLTPLGGEVLTPEFLFRDRALQRFVTFFPRQPLIAPVRQDPEQGFRPLFGARRLRHVHAVGAHGLKGGPAQGRVVFRRVQTLTLGAFGVPFRLLLAVRGGLQVEFQPGGGLAGGVQRRFGGQERLVGPFRLLQNPFGVS